MTSEEKFTFRQRWFPCIDDSEKFSKDKWYAEVIDFFGRYVRTAAVGSALLWAGCQAVGNSVEYSDGQRVGVINKISNKGLFWKTYEGEMALEGLVGGNNVAANLWDFSIDNQSRRGENVDSLYSKIKKYQEEGTKVKITYKEPFATWPWRSETDYLIQTVEPLGIKKKE